MEEEIGVTDWNSILGRVSLGEENWNEMFSTLMRARRDDHVNHSEFGDG